MDFYKILNETENHRGMNYQTGLNIDPVPFNPSGNCETGGIYFAREDILAFLGYGPWLRKVTIPEDARVYENPGKPRKWKADKVILGERERINMDVIKRLIEEGVNPDADYSYPLQWATRNNHIEIVKLLIPLSNPKNYDSLALQWAVEYGYVEIVKLLLPVSDITEYVLNDIKYNCDNREIQELFNNYKITKKEEKEFLDGFLQDPE
jgi:ankyrin repeat protein